MIEFNNLIILSQDSPYRSQNFTSLFEFSYTIIIEINKIPISLLRTDQTIENTLN